MKKKMNTFDKPWITPGLKISRVEKFKLLDNAKISKDPNDYEKYKKFLNKYTHLKNLARENYYTERAALYSQNKSKTWQLINELSQRKKKKHTVIKSIRDKDGKILKDPGKIANCLNEHFGSIGKEMADKFEMDDSVAEKDPLEYVTVEQKESMFLCETDESEIYKLICNLKLRKASGFDQISNSILKATCSIIAPFLVKLFNSCMKLGTFPDAFKIAQVIPLFKGGDKENVNSYRPISLLPVLGKLFEKVISLRTVNFLDKFKLLSSHQFGFRSKYSTEYAVLDIYEKLLKNMDDKKTSCAIFLDLAKAFDSVSHDILLRKLYKYGIRGNVHSLFTSYLSSRYQFVKLDNTLSSLVRVLFGVPQGSILGPLLFLIFINDLPLATSFFIRLFADDTVLCAEDNDITRLEKNVNLELKKVYAWLASNKLTLNISKTKFMLISPRRKIPKFLINIDNKPLEQCNSYKYLGVFIDQDLSWKPHIEYICTKISKACGALSKIRHVIGIDTLKHIYYALVNSYLRYGIISWGNASQESLQPLNTLINRAVRIISFAPLGRLNTKPIFKHLRLLNVQETFDLETVKFVYKEKFDLLPDSNIANHFERISFISRPTRQTQRNRLSVVPLSLLSEHAKKSIQMRKNEIWMKIPVSLRSCQFFNTFKVKFKASLIENPE